MGLGVESTYRELTYSINSSGCVAEFIQLDIVIGNNNEMMMISRYKRGSEMECTYNSNWKALTVDHEFILSDEEVPTNIAIVRGPVEI